MNRKSEAEKLSKTVKFRVSKREFARLQARADQFTKGNISDLVRHALDTMRSRPPGKGTR